MCNINIVYCIATKYTLCSKLYFMAECKCTSILWCIPASSWEIQNYRHMLRFIFKKTKLEFSMF